MKIVIIISLSIVVFITYQLISNYLKLRKLSTVVESSRIKHLTDINFQNQVKKGITLVDFWAEWCMPCKLMAPILNQVSEEAGPDVTIAKLNVEQNNKIASSFGVRSIPTLILFKDGKESNRFIGVKSKDFLLRQIERYKI